MNPGDGITNPDLLGMEDGLAAFEPPPPLLNEGHGAVTTKVDVQAHTNEVRTKFLRSSCMS
jgi:hypothetical protein